MDSKRFLWTTFAASQAAGPSSSRFNSINFKQDLSPADMVCYAVRMISLASSPVSGASHARWVAIQDMGVDHGGLHVAETMQFLNGAEVPRELCVGIV
jgi:hypothetical protein